jgi:4-methyl-5(b-hydroxyethyl)-thiazole monophosphate biosynthesis
MKGAYLFLAEGFEITEALTTVDVLRRGGVEVQTVSIYDDYFVTSSNEITVVSDLCLEEFMEEVEAAKDHVTTAADLLVFPGGMPGSTNLAECESLMEVMKDHYAQGGSIAAICAAPSVVFGLLPDLAGKTMTCYDSFEPTLIEKGANYVKDGVAVDGTMVTGRGAGHTVDFGLAILKLVKDEQTAADVAAIIML